HAPERVVLAYSRAQGIHRRPEVRPVITLRPKGGLERTAAADVQGLALGRLARVPVVQPATVPELHPPRQTLRPLGRVGRSLLLTLRRHAPAKPLNGLPDKLDRVVRVRRDDAAHYPGHRIRDVARSHARSTPGLARLQNNLSSNLALRPVLQ